MYADGEDLPMQEETVDEELNVTPEDEAYAFVRETVRPRPLRFRTLLWRFFLVICAAAVFGGVAGFVFYELQLRRAAAEGPSPVTIEEDTPDTPTPTPAPTETPAPTMTPAPEETTPTPTPTPTPIVEAPPTAEELRAQALEEITNINAALKDVAKDASASLVTMHHDDFGEDGSIVGTMETSGVLIADNGNALLVLADSAEIGTGDDVTALGADGNSYALTFQAVDPITSLAVFSLSKADVEEEALANLQLASLGNSYQLENGDFVIAAGEPAGHRGAFLYGILHAATDRMPITDGEYHLLVTDMPAQSGSDGVLFNSKGEVVGVIAQHYAPDGVEEITALPISLLKDIIEKLSNNVPIPYIGITGAEVPEEMDDMPRGIYVETVEADAPAMAAGVQPGDIITGLDGNEVLTLRAFRSTLMKKAAGDVVAITIERPGAEGYVAFEFELTIGALS